jgi:hypothetical protein
MQPKRVWFNQGFSNVYDAILLSRAEDRAGELEFAASHALPDSAVRAAGAEFWRDPVLEMGAEEYVEWCLRVCRERSIDLFIPGRRRLEVARSRARFEAEAGTRVSVLASATVLDLLEKKDETYAAVAALPVPLPEYHMVASLEEFDAAYAELRARHEVLCIKPPVGVYGAGFFVLEEGGDEMERLLAGRTHRIGVQAFRSALAAAREPHRLMLMEYLPGEERSVDAVAEGGELVAAVGRRKTGGAQVLETEGESIELARTLARHFGFSGIFNLQTKDDPKGRGRFLEVNSRMSGGMRFTSFSGVVLPYWSILLALGLRTPGDVPVPRGGLSVRSVGGAVVLPGAATPHRDWLPAASR